ncbi:MAG: aconitate hydratase, partial [Elusimicrobiota bacterium]|nr:aconitate hydratase [Elusimicrobiota bacterium]
IKGANIKSLPKFKPLDKSIIGNVVLKVGDNISTDHILPAGAKILPLRSNLPAISEYTFANVDKDFPQRAKTNSNGVIIGGENYGQGSSREHAALAPRFLGIRIVLAKSFARIHMANLINFGIIPLTFENPKDYDEINLENLIRFEGIKESIEKNEVVFAVCGWNKIKTVYSFTQRQKDILFAGGLLNWINDVQKN